MTLGAQAGEARLAHVFRRAGFTRRRRAMRKPFNLMRLIGVNTRAPSMV